MIELFEKRGAWCYRDADGKLFKFATKEEALASQGVPEESEECDFCECDPCECDEEYAALLKELEDEE